jgi:excisionase family DNA binding protein
MRSFQYTWSLVNRFDSLIGVAETAQLLSVSKSTVRRLARNGRLPSVLVGTQLRFDRETLLSHALAEPNGQRGKHPTTGRLR